MISDKFFQVFGNSCNFSARLGGVPFRWKRSTNGRGKLIVTPKSTKIFCLWALVAILFVLFFTVQLFRVVISKNARTVSFYFLYAIWLCSIFATFVGMHLLWKRKEIAGWMNAWLSYLETIQSKLTMSCTSLK